MPKKSRPRRSAFGDWSQLPSQAAASPVPPPPTPIDLIGVAKPKERNRQWEKEHRAHSYRGVPPEIHNQVVGLAGNIQVTTDEIVQVFVQYGLSCLDRGILTISPRPKAQRMTLFPLPNGWGEQAGWSEGDGWKPASQETPPSLRKPSRMKQSSWERVVTYRLSEDADNSVCHIAAQHTLPVGEIVTLFLKHGLESYISGRLKLTPHPKVIKMTLVEEVV